MLCKKCYGRVFNKKDGGHPEMLNEHKREVNFIKKYFNHTNWLYCAVTFSLDDGSKYTPDFFDNERCEFIEVAGSRQAYHANKVKYELFKRKYSSLTLKIFDSEGRDIESLEHGEKWLVSREQEQPNATVSQIRKTIDAIGG